MFLTWICLSLTRPLSLPLKLINISSGENLKRKRFVSLMNGLLRAWDLAEGPLS